MIVFIWRINMDEPRHYKQNSLTRGSTPYWLIIRRYWKELLGISLSWFIYDFIVYPVSVKICSLFLLVSKIFQVRYLLISYRE